MAYKTKEARAAYQRKWRASNPDKTKAYDKKANAERKAYFRSWDYNNRRQLKFGITPEEYDNMVKDQNGVCCICANKCKTGKRLAVDHCHNTGKIRGLLCRACNLAIGLLRDDPERLYKASVYLTPKFQIVKAA